MTHAVTALDGRYAKDIQELSLIVSEFGLMKYRLMVEVRWLQLLRKLKLVPKNVQVPQQKLEALVVNFSNADFERIKAIEKTTNHDVKAVEYFIREQVSEDLWPWIHFACTSEDINNLAYACMLQDAREVVCIQLDVVVKDLARKSMTWALVPMLARTHGQPATPTTMGKEMAVFTERLTRLIEKLECVPVCGKINGASGNYAAHMVAFPDIDWIRVSKDFIEKSLGFTWSPLTTQIESHDMQAAMLNELTQLSTVMIDFCNDMWLYISNGYFSQKTVSGEVGSSTMPHKVNPINFENARGNFGMTRILGRGLADSLPISTWQRDLTDSTLQRNFGSVFGHFLVALKNLQKGLSKIELVPEVMAKDLENNPEVLTEAIQTVLRKNGHADAYEQLKGLSRGHRLTLEEIRVFVQGLEIADADRVRLAELVPATYVGLSAVLPDILYR